MVDYTKYGKHRYQVYIFDDDNNIEDIIIENIGNSNVMDKYKELGMKFFPGHYTFRGYNFHNDRYVLNKRGFMIIHKNARRTYISSEIGNNFKIVYIDMMQLDIIPKEILDKTNFIANNRNFIIDMLI